MSRYIRCGCLCLLVFALVAAYARAAKPVAGKKKAAEPAKPAPAAQTVKKGPLKITLELDGVFEGRTAREIIVKPDEWSQLTVLSAAPHGAGSARATCS